MHCLQFGRVESLGSKTKGFDIRWGLALCFMKGPAKVCYIVIGSDVSLSLFCNEANLIHEGFAAFRI